MIAQERRIQKLEKVMIDEDLDFEISLLAIFGKTREEALAEHGTFHEFIKAAVVALDKCREGREDLAEELDECKAQYNINNTVQCGTTTK